MSGRKVADLQPATDARLAFNWRVPVGIVQSETRGRETGRLDSHLLRDALAAGIDAIDLEDCDMDENGNDGDGEVHECRKTRALALLHDALTALEPAPVPADADDGGSL